MYRSTRSRWMPVVWLLMCTLPAGCTTLLGEDFDGYEAERAAGAGGSGGSSDSGGAGDALPEARSDVDSGGGETDVDGGGAGGASNESCSDGVRAGDETDVDCGGAFCPACAIGGACKTGSDCTSGECGAGVCARCATVAVSGEGTLCIDVTEVTQAQYAVFLAAKNGDTSGQGAACSWNDTLEPAVGLGACDGATFDPVGAPDLPVVCVDWCDAAAYCAWAGVRLCGALSGGKAEFEEAEEGQWSYACTGGGDTQFPYGDVYEPSRCNGAGYGAGAVIPVGQAASCHAEAGPLSGVADLSGNVWEWEDACKKAKNADDPCRVRGGSYATAMPACDAVEKPKRSTTRPDLGFRCCS